MADEEIYKDDEESIENAVQFTLDYLKRLPLTINQDDPDVEKDLNIFLTHKLQGDDSKLIFNSGLLFNLAHKIYAYSKKNQKKNYSNIYSLDRMRRHFSYFTFGVWNISKLNRTFTQQ